jgi:two-component system chemotaxis response regulator CheB
MIRVLVVDDSAYSRQTIRSMLENDARIRVVGLAADGNQALQMVARLRPDVITLDLEMPRLDGFTFLRILTYRHPTPVIVVSSYAGRADVLRALDLGALDFVAKPAKTPSKTLWKIKEELVAKVREAASAKMEIYLRDAHPEEVTGFHSLSDRIESGTQPIALNPLPQKSPTPSPADLNEAFAGASAQTGAAGEDSAAGEDLATAVGADTIGTNAAHAGANAAHPGTNAAHAGAGDAITDHPKPAFKAEPQQGVILVASSTGGPRALRKLLPSLVALPWPVAVVQHMPPRFTREFAARLERKLDIQVREAADGSRLTPGRVLLAPGGFHMTVEKASRADVSIVRLRVPDSNDRYVPSADILFASAAQTLSFRVVGIVLTGMGNDGTVGARAIREAGGRVVAEDRSTAVVYGMPQQAIRSGSVDVIAPLDGIATSVQWMINQSNQDS